MGELVGRPHNKVVKRKTGDFRQSVVALFRHVFFELIAGQNQNLHAGREEIGQSGLEGVGKAALDDVPLKLRGGVQSKHFALNSTGRAVRKPGVMRLLGSVSPSFAKMLFQISIS
jgi:hypothetical protein